LRARGLLTKIYPQTQNPTALLLLLLLLSFTLNILEIDTYHTHSARICKIKMKYRKLSLACALMIHNVNTIITPKPIAEKKYK
jgi:hypothetical protein